MSTSSNEGKSAIVSDEALKLFVTDILPVMGDDTFLASPLQISSSGLKHVAANDGSIGVNYPGFFGSDRNTEPPVINFEVSVFAKEVAEMIGSMFTQRSKIPGTRHNDQETFIASMHGTLFYISAAYFSPEYIKYLEAPPQHAETNLWWALINYVASGEAKINIVTAAIDAAPR
ncbi:hypothetical protein P175DRAFT_0535071 [Aspergillus ochraceoroseus IBT 24754]|uniref:Uncharacterized protein n=1 Tax=Aspergillus ochraceoroseus IBT 24754 TaxID=1392256 RepID=A0A2T5LPF0_9EURO|nr:uncharacterized protein P175DRAFT_0535071 [Aspergillus ochraceoroseus IBT 24754]PTU18160.1 hypothetical protein P175DRAFT_0535071 [Aspergillus ochraceoroseus IBT 24754]